MRISVIVVNPDAEWYEPY